MKEKLNFSEKRREEYLKKLQKRWDDTYSKEGYKASHDAGSLEKTMKVSEIEMDLFLFSTTKENCEKIYNDKNLIPRPTFGPHFYNHKSIKKYLGNDLSSLIALEYGSGYMARYSDAMAKYFRKVYALDVSEIALNESKKILKNKDKIDCVHVNGVDLYTFSDSSIDFIFSNLVFQHIGNKEVVWGLTKDFSRILKPGGVVRIEYSNCLHKKSYDHSDVYHGNGFTKDEINEMYSECGLKVETITEGGLNVESSKEDKAIMWVTGTKNI